MGHDTDVLRNVFNRHVREVNAVYCQAAAACELSESAFWILYTIANSPHDYSQHDICSALYIPKTTINSAIKSLSDKGYILLRRDTAPSRRKIILMTERGREFAELHITPLQEAERKAFLKMDVREQESYIELSQKYALNLRKEIEMLLEQHQKLKSMKKEVSV